MPRMRWNAKTGEPILLNKDQADPPGYLDHHPDDEEKGGGREKAQAKAKLLPRKEVIQALKDGDVSFDAKAGTEELNTLLLGKLREALTAQEIEFGDDMGPSELLALIKGQ